MADADRSTKDYPPQLRRNLAADRLARSIYFSHCEAEALPYRSWDDLTTDQRLFYRAAAVESLSFVKRIDQ